MEMILSGEVIACRNSEKKTIVLYPRGNPFYAALSGTLTARPGMFEGLAALITS
jgi:hypothetical protein